MKKYVIIGNALIDQPSRTHLSPASLVGVGDYIPNGQTLNEVVVTAKAPEINPQIGKSIQEAVAASGVKPSGKDFLSLLRPKDRKRKKLGKKTMEALENY